MEKIKCPSCVDGKITVTFEVWGSKEPPSISQQDCSWCDGTGFVDSHTAAVIEYEKNMWCKCKGDHGVRFYNDGEHKIIYKHHYRCKFCGKVTQIG
jgi:hypothetical protein